MEINKPVRIGVDKLSDGLVTDVYSRETPSGQPRVAFAELENFEPTNNDKLITTQPFLPTSQTVVQLPSHVIKRAVSSQREGVILFAVTSDGVWRSRDGGLTWALVWAEPTLRSVAALSNQTVVAVGENGHVVRSTTFGDSWTVVSPVFTEETLQDVTAVEPNTFVAVGELFVYRSTDGGETWTRSYATGFQVVHEQSLTGSYRGVKVAHANGVYVSVAPNDARVVRSNDGLSWRVSATLSAVEWTAVVGAEVSTTVSSTGRLFVAVAKNTNTCWRSIDGVTWTSHALDTSIGAPNRQWVQVSYANGWFVAVSEDANVVARSQNGTTWTLHMIDTSTGAPNRNWRAMTYVSQGLPYWILLARGSGVVARSFDDGATWVVGEFGLPSFQWRDVVFANGRLVAVHDSTSAQVAVSLDGVTWSLALLPVSVLQRGIAFANGRFVVTTSGTSGTSFMHSTDGETWESTSSGVSAGDWAFVAAHHDKFLTMQYNGVGQAETLYSYDGIVWYSSITRVPKTLWRAAASGNGVAVAVATDLGGLVRVVRVGQDGRRWMVSSAPNRETAGIAFGAGIFLASVPNSSKFLFSTDNGATFQLTLNVFNDREWRGVASKENLFVVVAEGTNVVARVTYTSPSTFTVAESNVGLSVRDWNYITYCPESDAFVAVARDDWVIAESEDDGQTWREYDLRLFGTFDTNHWRSIAYGNGYVVVVAIDSKTFAVGGGAGVWTSVSNGLSVRNWVRVSYQRGVFCAVATDGTIAYSTSPTIKWTEVPNAIPLSNIGAFVGHEGKFVGIYENDTRQVVWGGQYRIDARGSTVVVVGEQGYVARSTDGGATWTRVQQNETTDVFRRATDISVVSTTTAVTTEGIESGVLNTGIVRRSTDGGATWARVYAGGGVLWTVGAPSATEVIAAGNARVIRSVDSGVTWAQINDAPLFHRTMVARNGQAVILGQGEYMLYASQASVPFTTAVPFSLSTVRASATVLQEVMTYDNAAQSGKYLLTDAWRFKTETNLAYVYEYSAFREEGEAYRRQSERVYYLNDVPVSLPLVTFATQGDRNLQKFIVSSTGEGEVTVRVFRPPMTWLNGGQVRVSQRLTSGDVIGVVSETYYLPTDKRLPMSPTHQDVEAFEALVKGCIGTVAYGALEVSSNEVVFQVRTVAAQVVGVSHGTTVNGTPYLDMTFRAAREMEKSNGTVVGQFPTLLASVGSLCFYSVQIFYSQYGYKVWHGVEGAERRVAIPLSQVVLPTDLESEFVFHIARAWIQRPMVYQDNAVWALPSAVTPRRTGGDSGSTYVNDRLYIDVAPNMVVFESKPKTMLDLPQYVQYNKTENKKVRSLFRQKFYFGEYSRTLSSPFLEVTNVEFNPSSIGFTWSYRHDMLNHEDYFIELEVVGDERVAADNYSMTVTLSNGVATITETVTFDVEATDGYVKTRGAVFKHEDTHWKRIEIETPDTTEAVGVLLQTKPFLTPPFDTTSSTTRTLSFSVPASITQINESRNSSRFYYYQLLLSPNNPAELTAPSTSTTPQVRAVNFFVQNTLGRFFEQIADDIKTALEAFFPSSNPTVTIQNRVIRGGQLNGILTSFQVYYDITVVFTGTLSPSDYLAVRARQSFTAGSFASPIQPAPELFFPFPTQRIPIGANTVDSYEDSYWHAGLTDTNAFYAVAVTAVYDGYEESDVIAWTSARGQFDYDYQTQRFLSFLFECDVRLNLAAIGKRLSYLKVYVGKFPQQSVQRSETPSQQTVFVAGVYETIGSEFDVSLLNAMTWVGVVIVDKAYAEQFDKGICVLEGSFQPLSGPLVRGGRYYFAPREAGMAMVLSGVELDDDEFSWVGGNFDTPQSDGGGLVTVNTLYPNQRDMPPYISGAWVSRTRRSFEPFFASVKFRITGAMFQRGLVQYRRGNSTTTYQSFIIPNGATSMMIRATSVSVPSVSDRVVYEAVPTGLGSVVNPNGTLSENLGRLVKSTSEVKLFRDRISSGVSVVVAGRRYFFMVRDEDGEVMIDRSISVRTAVAQGVPQYSFVDASFERQTNLVQYETQVAGDIVSAVRNRYNDFSENLRVLLVQDVQSKLLSVQGDGAPTVIQEFDGVSSPFARATTLTPYGICMMSPQGLYLINDNQVQVLSGAIDTLWRKEFDSQQAAINGDYPKESSATANPFVAQGFYDVETRRFYAMRNAKAFVYDFEKKCWFVNSLIGGLTTAFAILPARVMREENESLVVPAVSFDTPEVIQNYTREVRYQLSPDTQEYEADSLMTTNVFVAPPDLEYQVKRVSLVLSGGTSTALVERKCQIDIIEASTGNDGNVSIDGGNVTNIFEFDMGNSASERRHFDVPVNIGKNVRAFAVRVTTQNVRVVVEELNVTVIPRRRPVSQGVATLNVFSATPPTVELPTVLPNTYPVPIPNDLLIPTVFSVRLSNPLLPSVIRNVVLYDILVYLDEARTQFFASIENLTTAEVVEASVSSVLFRDITNTPVVFQGGRVYYGIARCRYLSTQADTRFEIATQLSAPTLSGFPSSVEVPTNSFFQGNAQRGVSNTTATQVEFEWEVGTTPQTNVTAFYNSSGNATGTFNLPSITAPTLIKVRARSKNANVIGEWSPYVDIDVTLFRPTPNFTSFTASTDVVALQADPTEIVQFNLVATYPQDIFGGTLSFKIVRVDTDTTIGSGNTTVNTSGATPITLSATFDITNTVTSQSPLQFRAVITRPDGQTFQSNVIQITFVPRPSLEKVRVFFNPNANVFKDAANNVFADDNDAIDEWRSMVTNQPASTTMLTLRQTTVSNRPIYTVIQSTATLPTKRGLIVSNVIGRRLEGIPNETYLPPLNDPKRNKISMIVVGQTNNPNGELVQAGLPNPSYRLSFAAGGGNGWEFTAATHGAIIYNFFNALTVFAMTFQRNQTTKLYVSKVANPTTPVASASNNSNDFANGNPSPHLNVVANTAQPGAYRAVGHIIIFEDTELSPSEWQAWFNWLHAIYKLSS